MIPNFKIVFNIVFVSTSFCTNAFFFFFLCHGCFSPRYTAMDCHDVQFRAVSHNSVRCLKILFKFFINAYRCDPFARFPGNLPIKAIFSIFSLRMTCPTNSSCLFSIHPSKFRF